MKLLSKHKAARAGGMSLIEMLVVISIIAILATLLFPVIGRAKTRAKIAQAKVEMNDIIAAINGYRTAYTPMPSSQQAKSAAGTANGDFTYGTWNVPNVNVSVTNYPYALSYNTNNSELVGILSSLSNYRNGVTTLNFSQGLNPRKITFLTGRQVDSGRPGIGADGIYRDPWGNPYIVSIDLNYDGIVHDSVYCRTNISMKSAGSTMGFNGLSAVTLLDDFGAKASVFVWSFGPDGLYSTGVRSDEGVNLDNILLYK